MQPRKVFTWLNNKIQTSANLRQIKNTCKPFLGHLEWKNPKHQNHSVCLFRLLKSPESLFRLNSLLLNASHSLSSSLSSFIGFGDGTGGNEGGRSRGHLSLPSSLPVFCFQLNKSQEANKSPANLIILW